MEGVKYDLRFLMLSTVYELMLKGKWVAPRTIEKGLNNRVS